MRFKKLIASFLIGATAFTACACSKEAKPTLPEPNDYYELQERISELYNTAIDKLNAAGSYKMTGSYSSVSEVASSGEMTTVLCPVDCTFDSGQFYIDSSESNADPHTTYFDSERYYFTLPIAGTTVRYFNFMNDHADFIATDYLTSIDAEIIWNPQINENEDGSLSLSFNIPFTIYGSPAMQGILGYVVDDTHHAKNLLISATIDAEGFMTYFNISFLNDTNLGEDEVHQEVFVGMTISDYATATFQPPEDLTIYEDWSEEEPPPVSTAGFADISGEH